MAFTPGGGDGVSSGTTDVTVVAAPAASTQRVVRTIIVNNTDTVSATVTVKYVNGASERVMFKQALAADATLEIETAAVLDATNKSIELVLAGAVTTNELDWTASWADVS